MTTANEARRIGRSVYHADLASGIVGHSADTPPFRDPLLDADYRYGYWSAHVEDTQGQGIVLYSPYPPDLLDPKRIRTVYEQYREDGRVQPLPWMMDQLIGSVWRNIYTGQERTIIAIVADYKGLPTAVFSEPLMLGDQNRYPALDHLGGWLSNGYTIAYYVRVDLLRDADRQRRYAAHADDAPALPATFEQIDMFQ